MADPQRISADRFVELMRDRLTISQFSRALYIFNEFGPSLSWDVTKSLMHAAHQKKVDKVLNILELHLERELKDKDLEAREMDEKTEEMFDDLYSKTLGLKVL